MADMPHASCRVVVTRALPDPLSARLRAEGTAWINPEPRTLSADELLSAAERIGADVLLVMAMDRIDAPLIARLPQSVRVIATLSVGHDHIDLDAARARGIAVLSTPDILSDAVADMAMLLALGAARRAREGMRLLYERSWTGWSPTQLLGKEVSFARMGIFGMGRIGRALARRARHGFGMDVHYHNRGALGPELEDGATFHATLDGMLEVSDFLVLTAPSTPATKGRLDAAAFARLPAGAVVVNVSRGDLIEDAALIAALRSGHVAAAGLNVFNNEPAIDPDYLTLPNVFLQPHQGSSTTRTRVLMGELLLDSIHALRAAKPVSNRLA